METEMNPENLRKTIGRFRVLILGRANAGKTTILQKVCNTTEQPEIYNAKGEKIDAAVVEGSKLRGNHDITNEMVFKSNPGFIFHDSCGFEAGSVEEFEEMKKFISERANATKLEERLHAIWYCIPMDEHCRTFQRSEEKFFSECNTGNIPVIAVFTKFEALCPVAFGELEEELVGLSNKECLKRIAQHVEELFKNTQVLDRLCDTNNLAHPKGYVRLENMNEPNTNCNILVECTTFALDDEELRLCLVLTQQSNLELCIKCAVETLVNRAHQQVLRLPTDHEAYQWDLAKWFPYLTLRDRYRRYQQMPKLNHGLFHKNNVWISDILSVLRPLAGEGTQFTTVNGLIRTGIATIMVLEYSAFLEHDNKLEFIKSAVDYYMKSTTAVAVEKVATEISDRGFKKVPEEHTKEPQKWKKIFTWTQKLMPETRVAPETQAALETQVLTEIQVATEITDRGYEKEELKEKILEFILQNRMSKDLIANLKK